MTNARKLLKVVALTGAGVSAESGLKTFRAADGLWEEHRIEEVATPEGFARNPALVHAFYNQRRRRLREVAANDAHKSLARLEKTLGDNFLLVTQNIDDLHERAGNKRVAHMHGELLRIRCVFCGGGFDMSDDIGKETACAGCGRCGGLRPDIVWFGEMPYQMARIESALAQCNVFVSAGTSGNVYPAAGFVLQAKQAGAKCVEVNLEPSQNADYFNRGYYGKATEQMPLFVDDLLAGRV